MINIRYSKNSISLKGHANYAPKGQDIVCAGASAIFFGAALSWFDKKDIELYINCHDGINLDLKNKTKVNQDKLNLMFKQLQQLAKNNKKYIKIIKE